MSTVFTSPTRFKALRKTLCAWFGHPPAVVQCFGYEHCARCGERVGDALGGIGTGLAIVGHNCFECAEKWTRARWTDRILTPKVITGPLASAEQRRDERLAEINEAVEAMKRATTAAQP